MDVKSYALGYNAGASQKGGNVSEAELEAAIKKVVPEWALEEEPPKDAVTSVNGKTGAVKLNASDVRARPSTWMPTAADVRADPVGTAEAEIKNHNTDNAAHEYIQQRIDALRTLVENFLDIDDESFDQLSEILRDIQANTSALELLGTNKVDKTAISTSMTDSNPEHVASMALIVALDNALTVVEQAIEDLKTNKQTAEQVSAAINNALSGYLTSVKAAELYQPKGDYLTPTTGDQRYPAKQATETALAEHGGKIALLEEALANSMVEFAESVEWLEANGDKDRTYYLPDGYEYTYRNKHVEIPFNANDGNGVLNNIPTNSTWGNTFDPTWHVAGIWVSPLVSIDPAQMMPPLGNAYDSRVVVSGIDKIVPAYGSPKRPIWVWYYKQDGSQYMIKGGTDLSSVGTNGEIDASGENGFEFQLKDNNVFNDMNWPNVYGVRIGLGVSTSDITKEDVKDLVVHIPEFDFKGYREGWYSTGKLHSDDPAVQENAKNITNLQERMDAAEEKLKGGGFEPLFGKLGLIGDSLTNQTTQGWQELAVSMLGNPEWHKNAVTGSSVADYGDDRSENPSFVPFIDRYLNTPADCDCIVIMGGSNDATYQNNYPLGTVGVLANNNYIGAYCTIIEGLFERNPATRIMLMTPPRLYTADRVLSTHIQKYVEATKEIAKYYGLPCLDLYDTLGWNDKTAAWCSANFAGDDPVHFSKAIGPRVGRMVANFIRLNY